MHIGLSMRAINAENYAEKRDAISRDWITWIEKHKHTPVLIPNNLHNPVHYVTQLNIQAFILTNGNDISDSSPDSDYSEIRNAMEYQILDYAIKNNMPVLGVCRGMQLINQYFGGIVTNNIREHSSINHVNNNHLVNLSTAIARFFSTTSIPTNSFHNHGIFPNQLSKDLVKLAHCKDDNIIESLGHKSLPVFGIQWHPERINPNPEIDSVLFSLLLEKGNFWK